MKRAYITTENGVKTEVYLCELKSCKKREDKKHVPEVIKSSVSFTQSAYRE